MLRLVKYFLALFLLPGLRWADNGFFLNEGDQCSLTEPGMGVCTTLEACPQAVDDIRLGKRPGLCSFVGHNPIVCCAHSNQQPKKRRIAINKCTQYAEVIETNVSFVSTLSFDAPPTKVASFECKETLSLIVGGTKVLKGELPHMAALGWHGQNGVISWKCGASIISERWLLSAAHCRRSEGQEPSIVRMGARRLDDPNHYDSKIVELITPPEYSIRSYYNDLLLVRVQDDIIFNKNLRPACLWHRRRIPTTWALASGWGQTLEYESPSIDLLKVSLKIYDNSVCDARFPVERKLKQGIVDSQLCAGLLEGGQDTCQGDSGGPLQITLKNNRCVYYLIGVTSFGKSCGAKNETAIYTRVSTYIDWIESVVWN